MLYLAIITFLIFAFLTYKNPLYALAVLFSLLPSYLLRFKIFGIPGTVLEVIIWAIVLGWLIFHRDFSRLKPRIKKIKWPLAIFFISSIIAIFVSPNIIKAMGIWKAYFLESLAVFLLIIAIVKDKKDFGKIILGLSISAIYLSLYAIGQRFFGLPIPASWQSELRATSIFPYPNALGLYLAPLILLFIYQIINNKKLLVIIYWLSVVLLSLLTVVLAKSDGAMFALLAAVLIFVLLSTLTNKKFKSGIIILLLILVAGGILFGTLTPIQEKVLLKDWSGFVRLTMWGESWNMLYDNWFLGAGLAGFQDKIIPYHASREWMEIFLYPHNIILNFWSELGLIGLIAFIWLLESFARMCYKLILKRRKSRTFIIISVCAMTALVVHGLVDVPYFKNDLSILFWIIFSMPLVLSSRT